MINYIRMVYLGQEVDLRRLERKIIRTNVQEEFVMLVNGILGCDDHGFRIKASFMVSVRNDMDVRNRILEELFDLLFVSPYHL